MPSKSAFAFAISLLVILAAVCHTGRAMRKGDGSESRGQPKKVPLRTTTAKKKPQKNTDALHAAARCERRTTPSNDPG